MIDTILNTALLISLLFLMTMVSLIAIIEYRRRKQAAEDKARLEELWRRNRTRPTLKAPPIPMHKLNVDPREGEKVRSATNRGTIRRIL